MRHRRNSAFKCRRWRAWTLASVLCLAGVLLIGADHRKTSRRAKPPAFDPKRVGSTFFPDVFAKLQGDRPVLGTGDGQASRPDSPSSPMEGGGSSSSVAWDELISASSIEDEVKSLKLALNQSVTTPSQFRSRGYKAARREFTLLNMLFWIVEHYQGDVRWKADAKAARQKFGSVAGNAKAGANEQTYAQAKQTKDLLDRLLRGERAGVEPDEDEEVSWEPVSPRRPLMQWLEERYEADLKAWTSNDKEFQAHGEDVLREAEVVAAIGQFFLEEGMDDAEDEEYRAFSEQMKSAAQAVVSAVKQNDLSAAQSGVGKISQACSNCHDAYR